MDIYLDSAATAKYRDVDDIIVATITNAMKNYWKNPSSLYASHVKEEIDRCRKVVADFIGANPEEIIFTSGSSESNNFALRGWAKYEDDKLLDDSSIPFKMAHIITTPIEHKSILQTIENDVPALVDICMVNKFGIVDYDDLEHSLSMYNNENAPILVSICAANNEIGVIQDIKKISDLVHKYNGVLHIDATQAVGHVPINVEELGIDMMSVSGHKLSPVLRGIGYLYKKNGINIHPIINGVQEQNLRGGTENTYGIIGLAKAAELCDVSDKKVKELCEKRDYFLNLLEDYFACKLNGPRQPRLPNNINVTFPQNITGESLLYTLDLAGIKISTGSACNSHSIEPSHVLKAIGLSDEDAMKTVRFTLPEDITYEQINFVINEIDKAIMIIEA